MGKPTSILLGLVCFLTNLCAVSAAVMQRRLDRRYSSHKAQSGTFWDIPPQEATERHWLGERPTNFLNARLNAASDS